MTYNELHSELAGHPKTRRLCRALDIPIPTAIGHLALMWWWVMDYAPDGDLSEFENEDIALASMWNGDADQFVTALLTCGPKETHGFLETDEYGRLVVHDWMNYGGKLHEKRLANAERQAKWRERHKGEPLRNSDETDDTALRNDNVTVTSQLPVTHRNGYVTEAVTERNALEERREENRREEEIERAPATPSRARDYHFEALAEVCDVDLDNRTQRGRLNKAVADIKAMGGTPQQIPLAAQNYHKVFPADTIMTPTAIAAHWRSLIEHKTPEPKSPYTPFDPNEIEPLFDDE